MAWLKAGCAVSDALAHISPEITFVNGKDDLTAVTVAYECTTRNDPKGVNSCAIVCSDKQHAGRVMGAALAVVNDKDSIVLYTGPREVRRANYLEAETSPRVFVTSAMVLLEEVNDADSPLFSMDDNIPAVDVVVVVGVRSVLRQQTKVAGTLRRLLRTDLELESRSRFVYVGNTVDLTRKELCIGYGLCPDTLQIVNDFLVQTNRDSHDTLEDALVEVQEAGLTAEVLCILKTTSHMDEAGEAGEVAPAAKPPAAKPLALMVRVPCKRQPDDELPTETTKPAEPARPHKAARTSRFKHCLFV
jgi:hypothetical protein